MSPNVMALKVSFSVKSSVTSKKLPNVYKSCSKFFSQVKIKDFDTFTKMPKNVRNLGKLIVAKCIKKFPKVQ